MFCTVIALWLCGLVLSASAADTYAMADGTTLTGDIVTFNDAGVIIRQGDDKYTDRLPWTQFSQDGLQLLSQNPKIKPLVEPFMELPPVKKVQPSEDIKIQPVSRLELPAPKSLLGALSSSSVGFFLLLMVYLANLYAAFEVAVCRARPIPVVMGVAAVLPIVGPAIFYTLPTNMQPMENNVAAANEAAAAAANPATPPQTSVAGQPATGTPQPSDAATSSGTQFEGIQVSAISATPKEAPVAQVFKRGQFTFNRRFFETKFSGFMQASRSEADKKLDFIVKSPQGEFVVQRISRVDVNDLNIEVIQGEQMAEIQVPFADIQEINIKTKIA